MWKYLTKYEEAVSHIGMTLQRLHSEFLMYEENLFFFYISVCAQQESWLKWVLL